MLEVTMVLAEVVVVVATVVIDDGVGGCEGVMRNVAGRDLWMVVMMVAVLGR